MNIVEPKVAVLFVSNLHPQVTENIVHQIFSAFGKVISVHMYPELPQSAIVKYATTAEADIATVSLHGRYVVTALPLIVIYDKTSDLISDFGRNHTMRVKLSLGASKAYAKVGSDGSSTGQSEQMLSEGPIALRSSGAVSYRLKPQVDDMKIASKATHGDRKAPDSVHMERGENIPYTHRDMNAHLASISLRR